MNDVLKELIGKTVEIRSQSGNHDYRDDGTLLDYDDRWLKVEVAYEQVIYFPIANVRLLKPLS